VLKKFIPKLYIPIVVIIAIGISCTKLDTTTLGGDLIPVVDNVNTFDTTLDITTSQALFSDSTKTDLLDDQILGAITNDPMFGTTRANMYVQFKPAAFPFRFGSLGDTLNGFGAGVDSAILCLTYRGFWGDEKAIQEISVKEITDVEFSDSSHFKRKLSYKPNTGAVIVPSHTIDISNLKNYVKFAYGKDSTTNQIRIKMPLAWATAFYNTDFSSTGPFATDSLYKKAFNGLAIESNGVGNALIYTSLNNVNSRLEIYYRKRNAGKVDTTYTTLKIESGYSNTTLEYKNSSSANYVIRNTSGYPASTPSTNELYLQTAPGSSVNLSIPGISSLSNRIVHRAEIIIEQIPSNPTFDTLFYSPGYLYLDLKDTTTTPRWKPIYFDLSPFSLYYPDAGFPFIPSDIDFGYFGGVKRKKIDKFGNSIDYYNINITRHLQQIVTKRTANYNFRLFPAYKIYYPQYFTIANYPAVYYRNNIALGRVKVGSGTNPDYKMRLRIIYSKI
jgi:hypothetical protein